MYRGCCAQLRQQHWQPLVPYLPYIGRWSSDRLEACPCFCRLPAFVLLVCPPGPPPVLLARPSVRRSSPLEKKHQMHPLMHPLMHGYPVICLSSLLARFILLSGIILANPLPGFTCKGTHFGRPFCGCVLIVRTRCVRSR